MGVLQEYHAGARRPDLPLRGHPRAVHRRRADGVLQRPGPVRRRAAAGDPDGVAMRTRVRGPRRGLGAARATTSALGVGIAQGYATLGRIGFEGRFDYAAIGSVTNLAARLCAEAPSPGRSSSPSGCHGGRADIVVGEDVGDLEPCAASAARCARSASRASTLRRGPSRRPVSTAWPAPARTPDCCPTSTRTSATSASTGCRRGWPTSGRRCASTTTTSRSSSSRRSPSTGRWPPAAALTQAYEERFLFLLLLLRQPRLRMVYVTSMPIAPGDHRVLPRPAARRDPEPRPGPAARWCRSTTRRRGRSARSCSTGRGCCARIAALVPNRPRGRTSCPTTRPSSSATSRCRSASRCTAPTRGLVDWGSKTGCRRLFAEVGVPHPLGVEDLHTLDEVADAVVEHARPAARRCAA